MSATGLTPTESEPAGLCAGELGAWKGMLRVHASLMKALDAELEATHRLPLTSYEVLMQLAEAPDQKMRMCDLADSVLLSRSGMSRLVDRLERDGLLERAACTNDARGSFAVLTVAGRELLDAARPTHHAGVRRLFLEHFDEDELELLSSYWAKVLTAQAASPAIG
ncbi:MAG TPA: MarR family transcriptional regulator [Conexibacter sp.]